MLKVLVTTTSFGKYDSEAMRLLKQANLEVQLNPYSRKLSPEEVIELGIGAVGIIAGTESLNEEVFKCLPTLKVISRCGVGLDNVDLESAQRLNIKVFSTPDGPTLAVAELTIGLILNLLRNVTRMDREMRDGIWRKRMGYLLTGKTVGIIGFGRIGKKVAELLLPFGVQVGFCDPAIAGDQMGCSKRQLRDLLKESDIICIHVSTISTENYPLLGQKELSNMKRGSFLVNCSRGEVVDEKALYDVLKEDHLSGAAVDVFECEPYNGPLSTLENVILTPHIGAYALEARAAMERQAVENLIRGLSG